MLALCASAHFYFSQRSPPSKLRHQLHRHLRHLPCQRQLQFCTCIICTNSRPTGQIYRSRSAARPAQTAACSRPDIIRKLFYSRVYLHLHVPLALRGVYQNPHLMLFRPPPFSSSRLRLESIILPRKLLSLPRLPTVAQRCHYHPPRLRPKTQPGLETSFPTSKSPTSFKLASTRELSSQHGHGHDHDHGHTHSHGLLGHHHHHEANPYLTSTDKTDPGVRITRIGLFVNIAMVITKGFGGWFFNSQALVRLLAHGCSRERG